MDWISFIGALSMITFAVSVGAMVVGVVIGAKRLRDTALADDDYPVQNDFGVSMDRFGYIQDARNGGGQ